MYVNLTKYKDDWYPSCSKCGEHGLNRHDINEQLCNKHYKKELRKQKLKQLKTKL